MLILKDNDMTTEDLDNLPTSYSSKSNPPPLPSQHPTRTQNLKHLKQHLQQPNNSSDQQQQHEIGSKRQMDINAFDSAFQKIQENVYGRNPNKPMLDSKGINFCIFIF